MSQSQHLEDMLAATVQHVRALHATLSAVMVDVAALRQSVLNGAEDVNRYKERVKTGSDIAKPLVQAAMRSYDDMIRQITDCEEKANEECFPAPALKNVIQ
jgi:hypothetical protein